MAEVVRLKCKKVILCAFWLFIILQIAVVFEIGWTIKRYQEFWSAFYPRSHHKNVARTNINGSRGANYTIPAVDEFVMKFQLRYNTTNSLVKLDPNEAYSVFMRRLHLRRKKGAPLIHNNNTSANTSSEKYHRGIRQFYMYDPDDDSIQALLQDLSTLPIVSTEMLTMGSQLKFRFRLADGSEARFKSMQVKDEYNRLDVYHMDFFEHYQAEIAGFHLDRVLGFYRAVPTIGRVLNITTLVTTLSSDKTVQHLYRSHTGNLCLIINCRQYCGPNYPVCAQGDALAGAVSAALPPWQIYYRDVVLHPYRRSYAIGIKAAWETKENYCNNFVKKNVSFPLLLEYMDLAAYDFLTGNQDRQASELFRDMKEDTFVVVFDNGRGFSQPTNDQMSILVPLRQCCLIRLSTLAKFIKLYTGPDSLSRLMASSFNSDPLSPVLTEADLDALERRVGKVLQTISDCVAEAGSWDDVVFHDLI